MTVRIDAHLLALTLASGLLVSISTATSARAQVIPGSGIRAAGDDFEDPEWTFVPNFPKSSYNIDKQVRYPTGQSKNGYWFESPKRGQPDLLKRVTPPAGGIPGSTGALSMRTLHSGIPGRPSGRGNQDDLIFQAASEIGGAIPVSWSPSIVVRVYLPPFEQWEDRTATSFGLRAAVSATGWTRKKGLFFTSRTRKTETRYPGIFIQFNSKTDSGQDEDSAVFVIRANDSGEDFLGPTIRQTGWWTLGMSFTADGRVHYYASPGVDPLTPADRLGSHFPAGFQCHSLSTFFFDVCNVDNGRTWSTEWIIDDPAIYYHPPHREAGRGTFVR